MFDEREPGSLLQIYTFSRYPDRAKTCPFFSPSFLLFHSNFSRGTRTRHESNSNRPVSAREPVSSFGRGVAILLSSSWNIQFSRMKAHAYLERDKFPDCVCKRCVCRRFSTHLSRPNISSNTSDREKNVEKKRDGKCSIVNIYIYRSD